MAKCVIYCRFSPRPDAATSDSNEKQETRCREYCQQRGYEVVAAFQDADVSGGRNGMELDALKAMAGRQGFWRALKALRRGYVLVVRWRHRIARDVYLQEWVESTVAAKGCRIEAADEHNGNTPEDRLLRRVSNAFDAYTREKTKDNTSRGMLRKQKNGRRMSRSDCCPYGYQSAPDDPNRLIPIPEEQSIIARMRQLQAAEASYRGICRNLDREGFRRRGGKTWSSAPGLVRAILLRENGAPSFSA